MAVAKIGELGNAFLFYRPFKIVKMLYKCLKLCVSVSLMLACFAGHLDIVKYLRKCGATWQSRDMGGCTALHWAADGGNLPVIAYMIQDSCEVRKYETK